MMEGMWLRTRNPLYHNMARFWTRIFGLIFGLGVATGIVLEFEFGTNWATYSRFVGDIFGSALAADGDLRVFPRIRVSGDPALRLAFPCLVPFHPGAGRLHIVTSARPHRH